MARMPYNEKTPRRDIGDILRLTSCILDSGVTCHMTPEI